MSADTSTAPHPVTGKPWHVPTFRPACWTSGDAATLPPRVSWAFDQAACCADHLDKAWSDVATKHTPGCIGCVRRDRAVLIRDGKLEPHPSVKTGPLQNGVRVAKRMPFPGLTWLRWMRSEG